MLDGLPDGLVEREGEVTVFTWRVPESKRWMRAAFAVGVLFFAHSAISEQSGNTASQTALRQGDRSYWGGDYAEAETFFNEAVAAETASEDPADMKEHAASLARIPHTLASADATESLTRRATSPFGSI